MKTPKLTSSLAALGVSSLFLAASAQAADIYWDGDLLGSNGSLQNDYTGNPDTSTSLAWVGSAYQRFNTSPTSTGGSMVATSAGDDLFFGFGSTVGNTVFLAGHSTGALNSFNFSATAAGLGDDYTFIRETGAGLNGITLGAGAIVDVGADTTARFETNSISSGKFATKNGAGTVEFANGNFAHGDSLVVNAGTFLVEQARVIDAGTGVISGAGSVAFRSSGGDFAGTGYDVNRVWGVGGTTDDNNTFSGGFQLLNGVLDARGSGPASSTMGTGTLTIGGESGNAVVYMENTTISNEVETASTGSGAKIIQSAGGSNTLAGGLVLNNDLTVNGSQLNVNGMTVDGSSGQILGSSLIGLSGTVDVTSGTYRWDNTGATFTSVSTVGTKNGAGTLENATGYFDLAENVVVNAGTYLIEQASVTGTSSGVISGAGSIAFRSSGGDFVGTAYDASRVWGIDTNNTHTGGFQLLNGVLDARFSAPTTSAMGTGTLTIGGESGNAVVYMENTTISNEVETASTGSGAKIIQSAGAGNTLAGGLILNNDLTVNGATFNVNGMTVDGSSGQILGSSIVILSGAVDVTSGTYRLDNSGAIFGSASAVGTKNGAGTLEFAIGNFTQTSLAINAGTFIVEQTNVTNLAPTITGAGKLAYRGSATPAFGQEWDLRSTTSTFSGGFDLLRGQIRVGADSSGAFGAPTSGPLGTGTFTIGGEGDAIVYSDGGRTLHNNITVASGPGTKTLLNASGANNFWSGNMTLDGDLTVETNGVAGTSSTHNIYNVTGTGGFTVGDGADATTLRLRTSAGVSNYSGTTTVNTNSTLLLGEAGVTSENSIIDLQGGTFNAAGGATATFQNIRGINGNGTFQTNANLDVIGIRTQTGDDSVFSGTMSIGNAATYIIITGQNGAGGSQTFNSAIGTVGRLDVTAGAIAEINSTASATGTGFVIENGGVLRGTSTLTGTMLIGGNGSQGILAVGNSIGTMNVAGNVDFGFGSQDGIAQMEIDRNGGLELSDLLDITGDLAFGLNSVIEVSNIGSALLLGDTFDLLDWTGSITDGGVSFDFTNAALGTGLSWDISSFGTDGTISVVPEPSAYALLGGLLALAWVMVRRRQA